MEVKHHSKALWLGPSGNANYFKVVTKSSMVRLASAYQAGRLKAGK